MITIVNLDRRE
jgi:hypothetical protein